MQYDHVNLLSSALLGVLRSRAFFDDVHILSLTLYPIKKSIATLESQTCSLSDCFIGLVQLGATIKNLPDIDHREFRRQSIAIFNKRFDEFKNDTYLVCFFLHPGYKGML